MDPVLTAILGTAGGASLVGYLAKVVFERGVLRKMDDWEARLRLVEGELTTLKMVTEKSFASVDKRLELGNQAFEHYRDRLRIFENSLERLRDERRLERG